VHTNQRNYSKTFFDQLNRQTTKQMKREREREKPVFVLINLSLKKKKECFYENR
jgi:hypothetical protein